MFSTGSGSHDGSSYPTHWALTPQAYQNNDQVDWAALAQQWIMMKEAAVLEMPVGQSSAQSTSTSVPETTKKDLIDEGGEAPMDMDENDKEDGDWNVNSGSGSDWNWQQNWGWNQNWNGGPSGVPPPSANVPVNSTNKSALLPTPYSQFPPSNVENNSNVDFNNSSTAPINEYNSSYWSNNSSGSRGKGSTKSRPNRKGGTTSENRIEPTTTSDTTVTLDASKRRQLPAWIREGLEKMEREKQKQMEREREKAERAEYLSRKKEETEGAMKLLQASGLPEKSKFDSDSEDSSNGREQQQEQQPQRGSKRSTSPVRRESSPPMTEEERIHQKMVMVRRAMTEVLLKVTNTEIMKICQEELYRNRHSNNAASAKKVAQSGTPGQGSVAAPLAGLGVYGGDSDSSAEDSDAEHHKDDLYIKYKKMGYSEESIKRMLKEGVKKRKGSSKSFGSGDKSDEVGTPDRDHDRDHTDNGNREHSQVDTAQFHGSGSVTPRRRSQNSSSRTPPRKESNKSPDTNKSDDKRKKTKRSSSSSNSDSEDSSSSSSSSTSSQDTRRKRRDRSLSSEDNRSRKRTRRSRSSDNSDSDDRSHSRSYSSRRSDRRERDSHRDRSRSRSRRRSRSRDRNHRSRERERHRSRDRLRDKSTSRDRSYRSRSRERTHRSRSRDRRSLSKPRRRRSRSYDRVQRRYSSPSGGKRSRR